MANGTRQARCRVTAFDEVELAFPYHAELVAALKNEIPYLHRSYDPGSKVWRVMGPYRDVAVELLLRFFPDTEIPRHARSAPTRNVSPESRGPFAVLHLLPTAPREVIDAAYRALAKLHHPDRGGDSAVMRQLTEAHDSLSRRLSA